MVAPKRASLARYHAKRDFGLTPEPRGDAGAAEGRSFVVQKHGARHLHYDFRLEWNGTLKSWAVPKGPSLDPGDKRLAVRVEDHPLDYGSFEGVIPAGEYGAGPVIVWDRGTWRPEGDPEKADVKGKIDFTLEGEKLRGAWTLVRLGGRRNRDDKNWLLIKRSDATALRGEGERLVETETTSVISGRALDEVGTGTPATPKRGGNAKAARPPAKRRRVPKKNSAAMPDFVPPQLATRVEKPPSGDGWIHEVKFDGYRVQCRLDGGDVRFLTRTGLDWTDRFAALAPELRKLALDRGIVDGEVVVLDESGASDFSRLQAALSGGDGAALRYYAFDLLHRDGDDLTGRPLRERKAALAAAMRPLGTDSTVLLSEHFPVRGDDFLREACSLALEGAISKRIDAPYRSGRGGDWLKSKCVERQEMVVIGFTPGTTGPGTIGALLLAQHDKGRLVYTGRVGTGFTRESAAALRRRLDALAARSPAAKVPGKARKDARWVKPELVAEIEFVGWTADRVIRHAAFKGLREDKPARDVTREEPAPAEAAAMPKTKSARRRSPPGDLFTVLSHPDRVLYEAQGVTKLGLAEYYAEVAALMLPHVAGRPLSLVRCPGGTAGECFYQKSLPTGTPGGVYEVHNEARGKKETYPAVRDLPGLIGLVQMGTLELHIWGCKAERIMTPDRIVFDIDPDESIAWPLVVDAATEVRQRLADLGLESFLKTTGGKGLHVAAPIAPRLPWDTVKDFTKAVAAAMMHDAPDRYVVTVSKKARKGRIFVDYLRNGYGATFVAPYSPRARPAAPISMPLEWSELGPDLKSDHFRLDTVAARLETLRRDPWAPMLTLRQSITAKMLKAVGVRS